MAIVEHLADAQVGDEVWIFDSADRRFENGQFVGYGRWWVEVITGITRQSIETASGKFKKTPKKSETYAGFVWGRRPFGALDRAEFDVLRQRTAIAEAVREVKSVEKLLAVAEIVGFSFTIA